LKYRKKNKLSRLKGTISLKIENQGELEHWKCQAELIWQQFELTWKWKIKVS
jgi:hypothetical protein